MRLLSLFAGIGAFDLAASWLGWETVGFSEIDPFCIRVLEKHWPEVAQLGDIRELTGDAVREQCGPIDIITAGVPCQPASVAGKRGGSADDRWLWPDFFRLLRECRPRYVVAENVPGLIGLRPHGLDWVQEDLEGAGYQCVSVVLGADDVGAPHRRKRVWIVAYRSWDGEREPSEEERAERERVGFRGAEGGEGELADAVQPGSPSLPASRGQDGTGQPGRGPQGRDGARPAGEAVADTYRSDRDGRACGLQMGRRGIAEDASSDRAADDEPATQRRLGRTTAGIPVGMDFARWPARPGEEQYEWEAPRTVTGQKDRAKRLKALGNSCVPQCCYIVLKAIEEVERNA